MTYITTAGDTWDLIAYQQAGGNEHIIPIMQANPEYTETFIFPSGVELIIPDLETLEDETMVLPPWQLEEGEE